MRRPSGLGVAPAGGAALRPPDLGASPAAGAVIRKVGLGVSPAAGAALRPPDLGASPADILRDVIIPGAMPSIFTGLQIAMGAAWFSLVAGEMIAAQFGLGFMIWESYNLVQYPTIIIGMATLGLVGYGCSAIIRIVGDWLMRWRLESIGVLK